MVSSEIDCAPGVDSSICPTAVSALPIRILGRVTDVANLYKVTDHVQPFDQVVNLAAGYRVVGQRIGLPSGYMSPDLTWLPELAQGAHRLRWLCHTCVGIANRHQIAPPHAPRVPHVCADIDAGVDAPAGG